MRCYIYIILLMHFAQLYDAIMTFAIAFVCLCMHLLKLMCVTTHVYENHFLAYACMYLCVYDYICLNICV